MTLDRNITRFSADSLRKELESAYQRIRALERVLAEREQQDAQRKITLRAIEQSEAFLEQSAEIAHLGYAVWDDILDRDVTVTEELARIHGLTRDEYLETVSSMEKYLEFVVPDDHEKYMDYENQFGADDSGEAAGVEYRIMRPDGEIRHLHQRSQYVSVPSGRPTQSIVVIQDITEQKQVEIRLKKSREALEESEAMLTQSVAMANLGHAVWDYVGDKYITLSEGWADIFGYTKEEFLATFTDVEKDIELIHPADRDRYRAYYENTEEEPDIEYRIVRRDGKTRHIHQRYEYVLNKPGERTKSLVTIQDITDRIEHENELDEARNAAEQASVAKSSFLALMSHEIRTPLNAVLGALGLIDSKDLDPSLRKFLNVGRKGAESLLIIINDILDFSKMEAGKLQLEPALFNVQKTIDDVLQVLEQRALERNISLTRDLDPDVPEFLIGDASRIRQVLLNLCSNGVRFTTKGGVHISLSKPRLQDEITHVRFQVEDTGCGVPPEDHEHLFEEFWGTSTNALGNAGNTGLGLPISKQLVEMMGGSIGFESEPRRGSIFWFELPLEIPGEEAVKVEKNKSKNLKQIAPYTDLPILQGRVLLAEDNPANQLIGQTILERFGLRVDSVANGHEVIEALRNVPYDVILMDINMPEMDGIEATAAIRKLPGAMSSIPIIATTALAMAGDRERFLSRGMDGYISKPIIREELYACIASVLEGLETLPATTNILNDMRLTDTDTSIIDAKILSVLIVDVGTELLPQIIDTYLSEAPARVDAITAAAACGNCELVAKEAHPLKSSSANLGAMRLAELASQLEHAGREHDLEKIVLEVLHLPSLFEQTREELLRVRRNTEESGTSSSK
ncbi:ATP-binding protein [Gammaproteobacteria bacterium]|nr:ATP-binding protein [Gammaproteobacteria bacterium]